MTTTLGETLREARQAKGASLEDVEALTKIRAWYVQALEEERHEQLPSPVYVRGFLRNYAIYLGLDPQDVLDLYNPQEMTAPAEPRLLAEPLVTSPWLRPARLGAALIVLAALITFGLWWSRSANRAYDLSSTVSVLRARLSSVMGARLSSATPIPTITASAVPVAQERVRTPTPLLSPTDTPVRLTSPTATPTPAVGIVLSVVVSDTSWVEVISDGAHIFAKLMNPGETGRWSGQDQLALTIGNGGGVVVTLNNERIGVLGQVGEVVSREWLRDGAEIIEQVPTPVLTYTPEPETETPAPAPEATTPEPSG